MTDDAAGVGVGEPGLDRLADVDLVGEVVPGSGVGKALDEAAGLGLDVRRVTHGWKLAPWPEHSQGCDKANGVAG